MGKKHKKTLTEDVKTLEETSSSEKEKDNFYVFDSSLKNIFQSGSSAAFSISKTFDTNGEDNIQEEKKTNKEHNKPKASVRHNEQYSKEPVRKVHSWKEYFFFDSNDSRLSDGLAFFGSSEKHGSKTFSDLRKNLKVLVRHKISKNKSMKIKRKFGRNKWRKNRNVRVK